MADEQRRFAILLLVVGALLTAMSRVKLHGWEPFSDALAGLGFTLAALARSNDVISSRKPDPPPAPPPEGRP